MKFLIVGLGNIGDEYVNTRHNIGFKVLDALTDGSSIFFVPDRYASVAEISFKGKKFILVKPTTYMNLSGKAVNYWMQKHKIPANRTLIVTDDIALPFGTLRMKSKGSDGGHNGLKNINEVLGHTNYPRLRFGIGNEFARGRQVDYVLEQWSNEEQELLSEQIVKAGEFIKAFATIGIEQAMSEFNNK